MRLMSCPLLMWPFSAESTAAKAALAQSSHWSLHHACLSHEREEKKSLRRQANLKGAPSKEAAWLSLVNLFNSAIGAPGMAVRSPPNAHHVQHAWLWLAQCTSMVAKLPSPAWLMPTLFFASQTINLLHTIIDAFTMQRVPGDSLQHNGVSSAAEAAQHIPATALHGSAMQEKQDFLA